MPDPFHIVLKNFVEAKGTNILQASEKIGIQRQKFYRFMEGTAFPSVAELDALCRVIRPSISEKSRLFESYRMTEVGPTVYNSRLFVEELITQVNYSISRNEAVPKMRSLAKFSENDLPPVLKNKHEVDLAIRTMFADDDTDGLTIHILAQPDSAVLLDSLKMLLEQASAKTKIFHGIRLFSSMDEAANIRVFSKIVPLLYIHNENVKYSAKYHYVSDLSFNKSSEIYPNIIIRGTYALLVSSEMTTGIVLSNSEQVKLLVMNVKNVMGKMEELSYAFTSPETFADFFVHQVDVDYSEAFYFERQPCLQFVKPQNECLDVQYTLAILEPLEKLYNAFTQRLSSGVHFHQLFTRQGMDILLNEKTFLNPAFTEQAIPCYLQGFIDHATQTSRFTLHIIPDDHLGVNMSNGFLAVMKDYCVIIAPYPIDCKVSPSVVIQEEGVVKAFYDYFSNLINEKCLPGETARVTSGQEAIDYLKQCLDTFQNRGR